MPQRRYQDLVPRLIPSEGMVDPYQFRGKVVLPTVIPGRGPSWERRTAKKLSSHIRALQSELVTIVPPHENPMAAALEMPLISKAIIPPVRPPPKLHLRFVQQREEVIRQLIQFESEDETTMESELLQFEILENKQAIAHSIAVNAVPCTTRAIEKGVCTANEPIEKTVERIIKAEEDQSKKSKNSVPSSRESSIRANNGIPKKEASEDFSTRNVPYMLEIWKRAEQKSGFSPYPHSLPSVSRADPPSKSVQTSKSRFTLSDTIFEDEKAKEELSTSTGGTRMRSPRRVTVSRSTMKLLRKLAHDGNPSLPLSNSIEKLQAVLMGDNDLENTKTQAAQRMSLGSAYADLERSMGTKRFFRPKATQKKEELDEERNREVQFWLSLNDAEHEDVEGETASLVSDRDTPVPADKVDGEGSNTQKVISERADPKTERGIYAFNLARIASMISRVVKKYPSPPPKRDIFSRVVQKDPYEIDDLRDFLLSPVVDLKYIPPHGTREYSCLVKAMLLVLREDDEMILCTEAIRILVAMNAHLQGFSRWDGVVFKNAIQQMILSGRENDRFLAAIASCQMKALDEDVLEIIFGKMGDLNEQVRSMAVHALATLDLGYKNHICLKLIEFVQNTNWRVRIDVVDLLSTWLKRLSVTEPHPDEDDIKSEDSWKSSDESSAKQDETLNSSTNDMEQANPTPSCFPEVVTVLEDEVDPEEDVEPKIPEISEEELRTRAVDSLLDLMWNDWCEEVRTAAAVALGGLGKGSAIFSYVVENLRSANPARRSDALKCIATLKILTKSAMKNFLECFHDPFTSVRIEACKTACILRSKNRHVINGVLDCCHDSDWKVRAYGVKALGLSNQTTPKAREVLFCFLYHEVNPVVRAEAVRATKELGLISIDPEFRDAVEDLLEGDKSTIVRREVNDVLASFREQQVNQPTGEHESRSLNTPALNPALPSVPEVPSSIRLTPHNDGKLTLADIDVLMREDIVGAGELAAVIQQVKALMVKENVLKAVNVQVNLHRHF